MVDVVDAATRSRMMSGIRGKNTRPELAVRSFLHRQGLRFRLHQKLPGKPDVVFPKYRAVVFVHGCFWHRHAGCRFATTPSSNMEFWSQKFDANVKRDAKVRRLLKRDGWRVFVVWSCKVNEQTMMRLSERIRGQG